VALPTTVPTDVLTDIVGNNGDPIPGQYIVVFKDDLIMASSVNAIAAEMAAQYGGAVIQNYEAGLTGFAAQFPVEISAEAVSGLQQDERVAYVEQDVIVSLDPIFDGGTVIDEPVAEISASAVYTSQLAAPWGLDRIDQRLPSLDKNTPIRTRARACASTFLIRGYAPPTVTSVDGSYWALALSGETVPIAMVMAPMWQA